MIIDTANENLEIKVSNIIQDQQVLQIKNYYITVSLLQILISKTVNTKYWKKEWTCLEISLEAGQEHSLQNVAIISQDFLPYPWRC